DSARRFVENKHARPAAQPLSQHDLLLISAAKQAGCLADAGRTDTQAAALSLRQAPLALARHQTKATEPIERWQRDVVAHAFGQNQTLGAPILRYQVDPRADGIDGPANSQNLIEKSELARNAGANAKNRSREPGPAGADQARQPNDFPGAQVQIDRRIVQGPAQSSD